MGELLEVEQKCMAAHKLYQNFVCLYNERLQCMGETTVKSSAAELTDTQRESNIEEHENQEEQQQTKRSTRRLRIKS